MVRTSYTPRYRKDITIGVTYDGEMWVAQGSAQSMMTDPNGELYARLSDIEEGIGFSALKHRTIMRVEGGYQIVRPCDLRGDRYGPTFYTPDIRGGRLLMVGRSFEAEFVERAGGEVRGSEDERE